MSERRYYYNYAEINWNTNMCVGVQSTTVDCSDDPNLVPIPVYDEEYVFKYYIDGNWYEDAAGTIPWQSSLL